MATEINVLPSKSGVKPRVRGWKKWLTHQGVRRLVQAGFVAFIAWVTYVHISVGEDSGIVTASPEAFCPFGGIETFYNYLVSGGKTIQHTHLSNLVLAGATIAVSLVFRAAFCGWICPLGTIQDWVHSFSAWAQKKVGALRRFTKWLGAVGGPVWALLDKWLRYFKYLLLAWAVGGAGVYGYMVFKDVDPWSALLTLAEWTFTPGVVVLGVLLAASLFVERPWCRYACPLGAVNGVVGALSPFYLKREASACTDCKVCSRACPMGLNVHTATVVRHVDCISCLECVGDCPREGALELKLGLPLAGK